CPGAAAQNNLPTRCRDERGAHLEDEHSINVALGIERKIPGGDLQGGGRFVEARSEGLAADISGERDRTSGASGRVVIRGGQVHLCQGGSHVSRMDRPVDYWESS